MSPLDTAAKRLESRIRLTRAAMAAESLARAFWPLWTVAMFAGALWAFGGLAALRADIGIAVLGVAGLAALVCFGWGVRRFDWPTRAAAVERLDAVLPGRPLAALGDSIAVGRNDAGSQAVWARHLERMADLAAKARAARPDLRLSRRDPWALRLAGLVAVLAALVFARAPDPLSLQTGLGGGEAAVAAGPSFEAWANPPAYTGKPTIYLTGGAAEDLELPEGTEVTLRVYGTGGDHALEETVSGSGAALDEIAEGILSATFSATRSGAFALREGTRELGAWEVSVIPDAAPTIEFDGPIERSASGALELAYAAADDYGVVAAEAVITLDMAALDRRYGLATEPEPRSPIALDLPLPLSGRSDLLEETLVEDLSKHPWVGLPVSIRLKAFDAAGQDGAAILGDVALPGRRFFDPLARAVIEQRRDLLWSKENAARVDQMLRTITYAPEDLFTNQTAFMVTRMALRRMGYAREDGFTEAERDDIAEMLWQAALLIEDGSLSDARERLRRAQDRLSDALRNGATEEEIAQLMQELREAMQEYMQQLAEEALRNQDQQAENQPSGEQMELTQDQLQQLLDRIQELAESGQQEQAEALLEQLRQMLENLQMQITQGGQNGQQQGQQMLQELQDTLRQQQDLADESFQELQRQFNQGRQQGQQGQPGQQGQQGQQGQGQQGQNGLPQPGQPGQQGQGQGQGDMPSAQELARRQEALRGLLDELRGRLPGPGTEEGANARERLGDAETEMGRARDRLDEGDLGRALDRQADALDALRDGIRGLGEELQQQAQQNQGDAPTGPGEGLARDNRDPLGRPAGPRGNIRTDENLLPGEDAMRRARELFDEIRRRSGEQTRPQEELDYLRRLLDRF